MQNCKQTDIIRCACFNINKCGAASYNTALFQSTTTRNKKQELNVWLQYNPIVVNKDEVNSEKITSFYDLNPTFSGVVGLFDR